MSLLRVDSIANRNGDAKIDTAALIALLQSDKINGSKSFRVAQFGDSRLANGTFVSANQKNVFNKPMGPQTWIQSYSNGRVIFPWNFNFGVSGDNTIQMMARQDAAISAMKNAAIDTVLCIWGTNDPSGGIALETTKRNIILMVEKFQKNGIRIVAISESPRGGMYSYNNQTLYDNHLNLHNWQQNVLPAYGVFPVNVWDATVNPSSPAYEPIAEYYYDNLHPSIRGAALWGKLAWEQAFRLLFLKPSRLYSDSVLYSASTNPTGSVTKNALLTGTSGSITSNANPTAGSVIATNWNAEGDNLGSIQVSFYKESNTIGEKQCIRIQGTSGSNAPTLAFYQDLDLSLLTNGDQLEASCYLETLGDNIACASLNILQVPAYALYADGDAHQGNYPAYQMAGSRTTPAITYDSSSMTLLRSYVNLILAANATLDITIKVSQFGTRKVLV